MMTASVARGRRRARLALAAPSLLLGTIALASEGRPAAAGTRPELPQGAAVAEVTQGEAILWGRCPDGGDLRVSIGDGAERSAPVAPERDFAARVELTGLESAAEHVYRARCVRGEEASEAIAGRFRTAPPAASPVAARFAFGGDLGGQNVCRDAARGYPVFAAIAATRPDFFIALGDMIYADNRCLETGRLGNRQIPGPPTALERSDFWAHWRYNRSDAGHRELLASLAYYPVWDDHEVVNDFGPTDDTPREPHGPDRRLMGAGLAAFLDYNPVRGVAAAPDRLYRSFRWGRHVEIFFLDARRYRDANAAPDLESDPKTLLGAEQREWLLRSIAASDATWKIVVSSVPLSIPTGSTARDGWASGDGPQGFERELRAVLERLRRERVRGIVVLTTDVHFATAFRYRPFPEDPEFELHELVTGPMHAGLAPQPSYDATFAPVRLFYYAPSPAEMPRTLAEALPWFNFGLLEITEQGEITARVIDATGKERAALRLAPAERSTTPKEAHP
jgi:alkaline phosphatase D